MSQLKDAQTKLQAKPNLSETSITSEEVWLSALVISHAILNPCKKSPNFNGSI